ncbi:unnamed protein product [Rotaria socialis]|uniref:SH3 domain-containing protein n=1 Tax=Rotaria socialis TaxID=392032 RepID=A0A820I926_9BILA|nr:unnamed protein product [Rotaria socialis]CAF3178589.1 unnamed protein product [Rotaria socialis]CAF3323846.1 unnamed protein product [Rotaria socialis]CAF3487233.1 unnamed protein product [Rotaria socialis]CAF4259128.1 unnamed protein product [Rotaria socialis]
MSAISEIGNDKQSIETSLNGIHNRLKCYTNDQITIVDDMMSTVESFYKTEKHTHEKMNASLQKSLEHAQGMSYLGPSIIGSSWTTALKELMEHYAQREASHPVLKQVILENLKRIRNEKVDEHSKVLLYDDEIMKEMVDIERRTIKSKRTYDDACERLRQHINSAKEKESSIKRIKEKMLPKNELERLENAVVDTRNMYILHVQQMNYALKFYIEQFIIDLDKLLVCDIFPQIEQVLEDLVYIEYKRLRDTLQRAIHVAAQDGDEQKRRLLPKTFQNYPLVLVANQSDQIITEEKHHGQFLSCYQSAANDLRDVDQQIQLALESSLLNAQQNKDSRIDAAKIKLKRMEMRKTMVSFIIDSLETLVPEIKTISASARTAGSKLIGSLKPFISSSKTENTANNIGNPIGDANVSTTQIENEPSSKNQVPSPMYPCQAIVLYDFEGTNDDEMSVRKDDKIFIESKPEYEGWLVAKGRERSGLVPEAYVQMVSPMGVPVDQKSTTAVPGSKKNTSSSAAAANDDAEYFSDD